MASKFHFKKNKRTVGNRKIVSVPQEAACINLKIFNLNLKTCGERLRK